jgi:hypothetical protein
MGGRPPNREPYRRSKRIMNTLLHRWLAVLLSLTLAESAAAGAAGRLAWHGSTEIASGNGVRGPWQQNDSRYEYVDDPTVALNERGENFVAWVDQASKDVFFQRFSRDGAKRPAQAVNVSRSPETFSWLPRIVTAPGAPEKLYLIWQEIIFSGGSHGGDILFARSNDGGASFSDPINLSQSIGGDGKGRINEKIWHNGSLDLVAGPNGALHAAWTEYDGPLWFSSSSDDGKTFSRPRQVAGDGDTPARAPSLALGPDRTIYLAWTVGEDEAADIRLAKSADNGATFGEPQIVAPSKSYSDAPKLMVDGSGTLHLVYAESAGGPFARYRIRHMHSTDGARRFSKPTEISQPVPGSYESAGFPGLGIDSNNNLYVTWELFPDHRQRPRGLGMTISRDGGKSFAPPTVIPHSSDPAGGSNGSHQGLLMKKLAVNGNGTVTVVNSSLKQDEHSRVWMIRGEMPR